MIGTEDLEELLKLALFSGYLRDERPVSVLIAAPVESGKTELVNRYSDCPGVLTFTNVTAWALQHRFLPQIQAGQVKHILIPDIMIPLSNSSDVRDRFIAFMTALVEEGSVRIQTYATNIASTLPVRCGLITAIPRGELTDRRHRWTKLGFMSRMLPVSYTYSAYTVDLIARYIGERRYHDDGKHHLSFPETDVAVDYPLGFADAFTVPARSVTKATELYGFRLQRQFQALAMARAITRGRTTVTEEDILAIKLLARYINLDYNAL